MKHYHMSFEVNSVVFYSTEYYDNLQAVLDEANYHVVDILDELDGRSDYFHYDPSDDDSSRSDETMKSFESWIQQIVSSLDEFETVRDCVAVKDQDIIVMLWCDDVKSRFIPQRRNNT